MNSVILATPPVFATATQKFDRLTVFTFMWAVVRLFHLISFPDWVSYDKQSYLLMVAVVLALLRPQSTFLLILLLTTSMFRTLDWMPFTPNHILFEFYVDAGILFSLVYRMATYYWKKRDSNNRLTREQLFEDFAPMARISLILLYFYAVFHKLNWDYLNPEISCGTFLTRGLLAHLNIGYLPYWGKLLAVWGTLVIEILIPVLFLFRPTRRWGILLGLVFHFILALHPHPGLYSFSSLLLGFFYLFTPPAFNHSLVAQFAQVRERWQTRPYRIGVLLIVTGILFCWLYEFQRGGFRQAAFVFWYTWWAFVFVIYLRFFLTSSPAERSFRDTFALRLRVMWVFVWIVLFNGLLPYMGLKTQTSYSMFSNLRTEGGITNHVFMPRCWFTTHWQDDLITILRTDSPVLQELADKKQMITYFELRRTASETHQDFFVDYRRGEHEQQLKVSQGISNDPELTQPYSWPVRKLMRFRPVYADTCRCQH